VDALRGLAARLESERRSRLAALGAVAYPVTVMHVALVLPTIPLIGVPYGPTAYFATVLVGLAVVWGVPLALAWIYAARRLDPSFSRRVCRLPIVGNAIHYAAVQRFAWTIGMLHDAGETSDVALAEAGQAADCGWFRLRLDEAVRNISAGNSLADSVRRLEAVPQDLCQMIENGERAGSLGESMERAGGLYEERASRAAKATAVALGALTFAIAVLLVVVAVLGVMVPYFTMLNDLAR
jgi:type II secretory pathway component PulF